jgi:hypothetical protein
MPSDEEHYGKEGNYKQCNYYFNVPESQKFTGCVNASTSEYVIGEETDYLKNFAKENALYWLRGTFNAD